MYERPIKRELSIAPCNCFKLQLMNYVFPFCREAFRVHQDASAGARACGAGVSLSASTPPPYDSRSHHTPLANYRQRTSSGSHADRRRLVNRRR